ncbi:P-loop containing nucleoside triphosphate hydrolase protein [Leucogyrophana mollusca]|uniref:P-loop containing nucleoside triphosphate hydrolase protein n=1 Tax=Leucogyrophana mollusca TaxID=85980 RepID=A0ACB8B9X3_9AGAM|nr:P-loop containing nucleoside triphosphate hydrolase protein [Leucogyrophana mollusca]
MGIHLCEDSSPFDFSEPCIRSSWGALLPAAFVLALCILAIPIPVPSFAKKVTNLVRARWQTYLTLHEAEALDADDATTASEVGQQGSVPLWRTLVFAFVGLFQTLVWLAVGAYSLATDRPHIWLGVSPILIALTWLYATCKPVFRAKATIHYDLFGLFVVHLVTGVLLLGGALYEHKIFGVPLPPHLTFAGLIVNLVAVLVVLTTVVGMPFALPSDRVKKEDIGVTVAPEDYTTLWGWITFSWVYPMIKQGSSTTMNEGDVWNLSVTMQSRPVFIKFSTVFSSSLLGRLWLANSLDIMLDFFLTLVSVVFNYASPFFLKRILDAIDKPTPESRSKAYIYALLAFLCTMCKAQADVQRLWFGRRAATRMRSELMAAIYDKALKRSDYSGIVDKEKAQEAADKKAGIDSSKNPTADDPKAGADVGKIVNLMAGDSNRVAMMMSAVNMLYGAPLEIIIASVFLYNLLGLSAFAGFIVLLAFWPLNSYVTKRSIRIQKGVSASRDKRMAVLNELISAVKFIKFFAWEERWIQRAMDARGVEMDWMVKARINSVMFSALWTSAPILVSLISFFTYVYRGNELTVATAFTSIALFQMIRQPLNIVPSFIVQALQTGVALKRIETYLNEDEVTEQVSSIKKARTPADSDSDDDGLGVENGTFKWNEVPEETKADDGKLKGKTDNGNSKASTDDSDTAVDSESVTAALENEDHRFELRDISVRFPEGELSVITGPTASGKTALLMALLGEMTITNGKLIMSKNPSKVDENGLMHSISYAAQSPWLRHQSIKDNILFGHPYDEERYNAVVECCALRPDLNILEDGDETEIGARGVSLSGGQKARVALARAVYAHTKYILLDDPLSAVDSHTARFLYERLFRGPLLANRTVILVTHHVELVLPGTYYLVRMLDGRIDTQGTTKDLRAQGVLEHIAQDSATDVKEEEPVAATEAPIEAEDIDEESQKPAEATKKPRKLIKDEHRESGGVKFAIYNAYLKASSYWTWGILALLIACSQALSVSEKLWVRTWGQAYGGDSTPAPPTFVSSALTENEALMNGFMPSHDFNHYSNSLYHSQSSGLLPSLPSAYEHPLFYVGVYGCIGLATALVSVTSAMVQYTGALRASRSIFRSLLVGVVRATMRWHDVTPQGRMLNRFGKDIETIDSNLASSLNNVNTSLATFIASIITVAVFFPLFLIPAAVIGYFYRLLAMGYLSTGRDLRRMESNSRSPIFSGFGELLEGIVTVRAFSAERRFMDDLHLKIDVTTKMWYNFWMTNRWLLVNFDALGALAVLITTLFALSGLVGAGTAGLCITSAMSFTMSVYWACRFWTALELDLNSVERVVEYLDLPQEPPAVVESNRPPAYWPSSSSGNSLITVEDLVIKYAPELPPVLHNVSFTLNAKERIGLLGRTGSGKSTLAMSILRFVDPVSGRIMIDGVDISTIGIHDLRSRLTFIPQDATLFSGTLRDNLDPFGEHEDSECLDVLYRTQMISESAYQSQRTSRATSPTGSGSPPASSAASTVATDLDPKTKISLDTQVSAGGTNFSQGQRQLIAMARALLRRSSIIVLDEATSSIDFDTDAKIQATIREEFGESLLLTVAHRLRTVIDYDRLIVLDKGEVVEFDTPLNLIQKEEGIFRTMCLKSGTFADLEAAAKAKAERDLAAAR